MRFSYTAVTRSGERRSGVLEAADRRTAVAILEKQGLVPVRIAEGGAPAAVEEERRTAEPEKGSAVASPQHLKGRKRPRMGMRELLIFTSELSDLLASGMKLGNAMATLARRKTGRPRDVIAADLRDEIIRGSSLSQALARWPESFPQLYIAMVRAGEASGQLARSLETLARHYERVQEAREKVIMALIYPAIVLSFGALVLVCAMVFVVPRFTAIFAELGGTLPLPTLILIKISRFLMRYGAFLLLAMIAGVYFLRRLIRTPQGRRVWDRLMLRLPVVREIVKANAFSHFARTLGALLSSGVPVLEALAIVEKTVGNAVIAEEIQRARGRVTDGATISGPLAAGKIFPQLLTDMLAVGEESGDTSGALTHIARRYDAELDRSVKVLTTVLEPFLILVMAVLVGYVAISMLLAVFDLTSGLNV
ncbi:MAG: hypothetical protein DRP22_04090 [Verrucomicrobia bacterium]|nr:MAG: hypothetical protein DRP22_04090 [Verrucomicrobiota bacterium]